MSSDVIYRYYTYSVGFASPSNIPDLVLVQETALRVRVRVLKYAEYSIIIRCQTPLEKKLEYYYIE